MYPCHKRRLWWTQQLLSDSRNLDGKWDEHQSKLYQAWTNWNRIHLRQNCLFCCVSRNIHLKKWKCSISWEYGICHWFAKTASRRMGLLKHQSQCSCCLKIDYGNNCDSGHHKLLCRRKHWHPLENAACSLACDLRWYYCCFNSTQLRDLYR